MEGKIKQRVIQNTGSLNPAEEEEARKLAIMSHVAMNASDYALEEAETETDPDLLGRLREYDTDIFEKMDELGVFERDNDALSGNWREFLES